MVDPPPGDGPALAKAARSAWRLAGLQAHAAWRGYSRVPQALAAPFRRGLGALYPIWRWTRAWTRANARVHATLHLRIASSSQTQRLPWLTSLFPPTMSP